MNVRDIYIYICIYICISSDQQEHADKDKAPSSRPRWTPKTRTQRVPTQPQRLYPLHEKPLSFLRRGAQP